MDLLQDDVHKTFVEPPTDGWTLVYASSYEHKSRNFGIYCAFAPSAYRESALGSTSWDLRVTDGSPGFSVYYEGETERVSFDRNTERDGIEPFVLVRQYHGVRPSSLEIREEFRLFHNLYWDAATSNFVKFNESGEPEPVVEVGIDRVRVRTKALRQYQAARQMDFLIFIDSVHWSDEPTAPPKVDWSAENVKLERIGADKDYGGQTFTRLLGKRVMPAPPIEKSGVWPFESEENYQEFIIGTDAEGENVTYTCDHDLLANYFGANPDAPHYLTPVYFRKEVLRKYYDNPDLYQVDDGYLHCAGLWGVQIDNDHPDRVVVFLGDLGRDMPASERDYWRSFNVPPDRRMSDTGFRRSFLAQFVDPTAADLKFRHAYTRFLDAWPAQMGWRLFRNPVGSDAQLLQQIRVPLNESDAEFDEIVGRLAKLLCDGLDDAEIQKQLGSRLPDEKSISKLQRLLTESKYPEAARDIAFLRDLQELRSTVSAHAKGSKYDARLTKILGAERGRAAIVGLLDRAEVMLTSLLTCATESKSSTSSDPNTQSPQASPSSIE